MTSEALVDQRLDVPGSGLCPLSFPTSDDPSLSSPSPSLVPCLCCTRQFGGDSDSPDLSSASPSTREKLTAHLLTDHRLVIADVHLIAHLPRYCEYWAARLRQPDLLPQFCYTVVTNSAVTDSAPSERYFLLSPKLPEDRELRERLQRQRLEDVLEQQARERAWTQVRRGCLFCRHDHVGKLAAYFDHLAHQHNFSVGRPENLVFGLQMVDALEAKLEALRCLFCDGCFQDRATLKEHMRKKQHKKINPADRAYDRFYVINYLEFGKGWKELQQERDEPLPTGFDERDPAEDDWSDWQEPASEPGAVCLFCTFSSGDTETLTSHMRTEHRFDLDEVKRSMKLSFYQQVKLVNYIRRQMVDNVCMFCAEKFTAHVALLSHLHHSGHARVPEPAVWDQPQYFFPTYENDGLLYALEEVEGAADDVPVYAEEPPPALKSSVLASSELREQLGGPA